MKCVVMVVSGQLEIVHSSLSLDDIAKDISSKVPCLVAFEDTSIEAEECSFKGDTKNEIFTTGLLLIQPKLAKIHSSLISYHTGGGIIALLEEDENNEIIIESNNIF